MEKKVNNKKNILIVGRDNWHKDFSMNQMLFSYFKKGNHSIVWEDAALNWISAVRDIEEKLPWLPNFIKKINLRIIQISYGISHWNYFEYLFKRRKNLKNDSIEWRCESLRNTILELGNKKELIIISRSSGGRISSFIADELKIKHLICLAYPFKHPEMEEDPERYLHLQNLKTPFLIIQGINDEYGGIEAKEKYICSPNIEFLFVNTNHDFNLSLEDQEKILNKISKIVDK
jgi:predicted alpha/beta-hydrolase family hydrolase